MLFVTRVLNSVDIILKKIAFLAILQTWKETSLQLKIKKITFEYFE